MPGTELLGKAGACLGWSKRCGEKTARALRRLLHSPSSLALRENLVAHLTTEKIAAWRVPLNHRLVGAAVEVLIERLASPTFLH